jgi:lipopolysaccharide transport system ATP-binding protein
MNSATPLVSVRNVSKKYCRHFSHSLAYGLADIGRELIGMHRPAEMRPNEFWALQNVSFDVRPGESVALVGANGSGKTTLLRIISRQLKPDGGHVRLTGRVAPLIALGAGFNPLLTGRENIGVNLAILGVPSSEIRRLEERVMEFAEISDAIDAPLRTYSSGMAARLGFACAVHAHADIMIVDEVLAVGDIRFRAKCYRKLAQLRRAGMAFLLVTHNPAVVMAQCERAIYLQRGHMLLDGNPQDVMFQYEQDLFNDRQETSSVSLNRRDAWRPSFDGQSMALRGFTLENSAGQELQSLRTGDFCAVRFSIRAFAPVKAAELAFYVREKHGEGDWIQAFSSRADGVQLDFEPGDHEVRIAFSPVVFRGGTYVAKVGLGRAGGIDDAIEGLLFTVEGRKEDGHSAFHQPRTWSVTTPAPLASETTH